MSGFRVKTRQDVEDAKMKMFFQQELYIMDY